MDFSLFVVFEGSSDLGPLPLCRISDKEIIRSAVTQALDKAAKRASIDLLDDDVVRSEISKQENDLRGILALI